MAIAKLGIVGSTHLHTAQVGSAGMLQQINLPRTAGLVIAVGGSLGAWYGIAEFTRWTVGLLF